MTTNVATDVVETPARVRIDGVAGDPLSFTVYLTRPDDSTPPAQVPYDITDMTVVVQALSHVTSVVSDVGYEVTDPTTGAIVVTFDEATTTALTSGGSWSLTVADKTLIAGPTTFAPRLA